MKEKKMLKKMIEKLAVKVATADANTACPCVTYQPNVPKAVEKLRKF